MEKKQWRESTFPRANRFFTPFAARGKALEIQLLALRLQLLVCPLAVEDDNKELAQIGRCNGLQPFTLFR